MEFNILVLAIGSLLCADAVHGKAYHGVRSRPPWAHSLFSRPGAHSPHIYPASGAALPDSPGVLDGYPGPAENHEYPFDNGPVHGDISESEEEYKESVEQENNIDGDLWHINMPNEDIDVPENTDMSPGYEVADTDSQTQDEMENTDEVELTDMPTQDELGDIVEPTLYEDGDIDAQNQDQLGSSDPFTPNEAGYPSSEDKIGDVIVPMQDEADESAERHDHGRIGKGRKCKTKAGKGQGQRPAAQGRQPSCHFPIRPRCNGRKCECTLVGLKADVLRKVGHVVLNCENLKLRRLIGNIPKQTRSDQKNDDKSTDGGEEEFNFYNTTCQYVARSVRQIKATGIENMPVKTCKEYRQLLRDFKCLGMYMELEEVKQTKQMLESMRLKYDTGDYILKLEGMMRCQCDKLYKGPECLVKAMMGHKDAGSCAASKKTLADGTTVTGGTDGNPNVRARFWKNLQGKVKETMRGGGDDAFKTVFGKIQNMFKG